MAEVTIDLFCEDEAHELAIRVLVERIATEVGLGVRPRARSARGGAGRAVAEFRAYQAAIKKGLDDRPDLLVVMIDSDSVGWNQRRADIEREVEDDVFAFSLVGAPDPCIEAWILADVQAVRAAAETVVPEIDLDVDCADLKVTLRDLAIEAQGFTTQDGLELAADVIELLDWPRAEQRSRSLRQFYRDCRGSMQQLKRVIEA